MGSSWAWGSKRSSGRDAPLKKPGGKDKVQCPKCGTKDLEAYSDGAIQRHKVFERDKNTNKIIKSKWAWCTQKKYR